MAHLPGRAFSVQQGGHLPAGVHHLRRNPQQEASGVQCPETSALPLGGRRAAARAVRVAVQPPDGRLPLLAAAEHHPVHGGHRRGRGAGAHRLGQHLQIHQGRPAERPLQLREREFRAMHGTRGEQVQREHPHALLLQGQVPQGLGEHQQPLQGNVGGRHSGKRKDLLHHRAVHPPAFRQGLRDGGVRLQISHAGHQAVLPLQEKPEIGQAATRLLVQHHQLRGRGVQP